MGGIHGKGQCRGKSAWCVDIVRKLVEGCCGKEGWAERMVGAGMLRKEWWC